MTLGLLNLLFNNKLCKTSVQCDVGKEPCNPGGVSPSTLIALPCFTGAFLTGHSSLPVCNYGIRSLTLICTLVVGVLRVECPSPVYRTKDARITPSFSPAFNLTAGGSHD
jgi:hypothetical protein